jgi:hypothetical protein
MNCKSSGSVDINVTNFFFVKNKNKNDVKHDNHSCWDEFPCVWQMKRNFILGRCTGSLKLINSNCMFFSIVMIFQLGDWWFKLQRTLDFALEGDSLLVVLALQHPTTVQDWTFADVISDFLLFLSPLSLLRRQGKVHRSANFCTHHITY